MANTVLQTACLDFARTLLEANCMFNVSVKKDNFVFVFSNSKEKEDKRKKSNATLKRTRRDLVNFVLIKREKMILK